MDQSPIQDYAIIGDGRSAALVSKGGSIDWLSWPRFDSPPFFSSLLDMEKGGSFRIRPIGAHRVSRRYLPDTNVLETTFLQSGGRVSVTDFMPVASEEEKRRELLSDHELLRLVVCEEGEAAIDVEVAPRQAFGLRKTKLDDHGHFGVRTRVGRGMLFFRCDVVDQLNLGAETIRGRIRLRAGESAVFSLSYSQEAPAALPPLTTCRARLLQTAAWWRGWLATMRYDGAHRDAVARSALTLKLLIYAPSGAVIAAPTTSLPEEVGEEKNWDYRFCWLRDASFTVRALFGLGFHREAEAFLSWLLHSTRLTHPKLKVLYDVFGETSGAERKLPLSGYRGSRPVRVGNQAENQLQLDVYGEVVDAATQLVHQGGEFDRETMSLLQGLGRYVCENWNRPDEGLWEVRSGRTHHTHSRVLCWAALDRLINLADKGFLPKRELARFQETRGEIRSDVETRGWNGDLGSYVAVYDEAHLDAALLLLPWYGYELASSSRMRRTFQAIERDLSAGDGLLYRYRSHGGDREGAFGLCSFWAAEFLASGGGSLQQAQELFETLLGYGNDLALYGEEIDPATGGALGNFPQGFTHVGLVNAALSIEHRIRGSASHPHHSLATRDTG